MDHDLDRWHERARTKGASPLIYGFVRVTFQAFFWVYFRMQRIGLEHVPRRGPVIIAANHRSFLDPFVIACMARRPMYYVAKQEIFHFPVIAWLLSALGAFPVRRGAADADMITTAKAILARGDIVLIFPEGTRTRPGALGRPRRGVGRLALETGVPVVPIAVIGTEAIRRGWRIRPHRVRLRAGPPLRFPQVEEPSKALAAAVTDRIWPCVMLQWEWLGGLAPVRRVAVIGAGQWGTALAVGLARAGMEVDLGCRTYEQATALRDTRINSRYLPEVELPGGVRIVPAAELRLEGMDLVCLAVPAQALPAVLGAHGGQITAPTGVLVVSAGLVPPLGTLPAAFTAERSGARAVAVLAGPAHAAELLRPGASVLVASLDRGFSRQLAEVLGATGLDISTTTDVTGVEFAGAARNAAVLAAASAAGAEAGVADAAAGQVFAEVDALARARGGRPETFAGLAGAGDLEAAVVADAARDPEAVESVSLLATAARESRLRAPALDGLAALLDGRIAPEQWAATVTEPPAEKRSPAIRAA